MEHHIKTIATIAASVIFVAISTGMYVFKNQGS